MRIQHTTTKQFQTVDTAVWEAMVKKGINRKYKIISNEPKVEAAIAPSDLKEVEYSETLKAAGEARRNGEHSKALGFYEKAFDIKPLPYIKGHITKLKDILSTDEK